MPPIGLVAQLIKAAFWLGATYAEDRNAGVSPQRVSPRRCAQMRSSARNPAVVETERGRA